MARSRLTTRYSLIGQKAAVRVGESANADGGRDEAREGDDALPYRFGA